MEEEEEEGGAFLVPVGLGLGVSSSSVDNKASAACEHNTHTGMTCIYMYMCHQYLHHTSKFVIFRQGTCYTCI